MTKDTYNQKKYSKKKGASLLELLLYISIMAALILAISSMMLLLGKGKSNVEVRSEVNSQLRFALGKIVGDLEIADAVTTPSSTSTPTTTLILVQGSDIITYDVVGGLLRRTVNAGTPSEITSDLIIVATSTFVRFENTSSFFSKTRVSVKTLLGVDFNESNPERQYSAEQQITTEVR